LAYFIAFCEKKSRILVVSTKSIGLNENISIHTLRWYFASLLLLLNHKYHLYRN